MLRYLRVLLSALGTLVSTLGAPVAVRAQVGVGTWVAQDADAKAGAMTMDVEACCHGGRKLTYHVTMKDATAVLTIESPFDGSEAPVLLNGKPSGETMAITLDDDHHTTTVLRMNGQIFGTSKATLSADGKTLTVVNNVSAAGGLQPKGVTTEIWKRK